MVVSNRMVQHSQMMLDHRMVWDCKACVELHDDAGLQDGVVLSDDVVL